MIGIHPHSWLDPAVSKHHFHQLYTSICFFCNIWNFLWNQVTLHLYFIVETILKSDREQTLKLLHEWVYASEVTKQSYGVAQCVRMHQNWPSRAAGVTQCVRMHQNWPSRAAGVAQRVKMPQNWPSRVAGVAQRVKTLAIKPFILCSFPGTPVVEGENRLI